MRWASRVAACEPARASKETSTPLLVPAFLSGVGAVCASQKHQSRRGTARCGLDRCRKRGFSPQASKQDRLISALPCPGLIADPGLRCTPPWAGLRHAIPQRISLPWERGDDAMYCCKMCPRIGMPQGVAARATPARPVPPPPHKGSALRTQLNSQTRRRLPWTLWSKVDLEFAAGSGRATRAAGGTAARSVFDAEVSARHGQLVVGVHRSKECCERSCGRAMGEK